MPSFASQQKQAENAASANKSNLVVQPKLTVNTPIQKKQENGGNLPDDIQMKMENSFGVDFSNVKVHQSSMSAKDLDAVAYTQGNEIHFAPGYDPYSSKGQEYLGHELSHVVQQNAGIVGTTHQELGFNVNADMGFERQADSAGKKAASGQRVDMGINSAIKSNNLSIQKKSTPIQLLRLLPAGAPIFELNISNVDGVISTFSSLWNTFNGFGWLNSSFRGHPELPDLIRFQLGSNYFRGANTYISEWFDDGGNDWWNLGIIDNDVRIVMSLYVDNERIVSSGDGTFNSGGTTTDTRTSTQATTVTGGGTLSSAPAGSTGGVGGNVTGSASVTQTDARSMAVAGTSGLSMTSPAQIKTGNIKFKCELKVNPTGMAIRTREQFTGMVGTIRFGSPV